MTDREAVAREIDPDAWAFADRHTSGPHANIMRAEVAHETRPSLAKADRIIALLSPTVPEGLVLVPKVPTEAMIEAFYHAETPIGHDRIIAWSIATSMARGNTFRNLDAIFKGAYSAMLQTLTQKGE